MNKSIKDKVDNLDTLAGGIVFAKEEAWDKLAKRMDKRPSRKPLWYSLGAVAAALLITLFVLSPDEVQQPVAIAIVPNSSAKNPVQPAVAEPATTTIAIKQKSTYITHTAGKEKQSIPAPGLVLAEPAMPEMMGMGTIEEPQQPATVVAAPQPVAVRTKIPVIHINELEEEQDVNGAVRQEEAYVKRIERPHAGLPLFAAPRINESSRSGSAPLTTNPLQLKFNIQN